MVYTDPAPCVAQNIAEVDTHSPQVGFDPNKWHEMSQQSGLSERVDQSWRYRGLSGLAIIACYTCFYGVDLIGATIDSCIRYQASRTATRGQCIRDVLKTVAAYSLVGILGYRSDMAYAALVTGYQWSADTLREING